jgi:ankyrin repeat protein
MEENKMTKENLNKQLLDAAKENNLEQVRLLLEQGADVNAESKYGYTELLIKKGAVVNSKCKYGYFPLHKAAWFNSEEVAELLIKHGGK